MSFLGFALPPLLKDLVPAVDTLFRRFGRGGAFFNCGVEQLVARLAHNQEAAGSSPVPATIAAARVCCPFVARLKAGFFMDAR